MNPTNPSLENFLKMFCASAVTAFVVGCTSTPQPAPLPDESQLLGAGFKVVDAKTKLQKEYDAYCKVAPTCGSSLGKQHAADMASYNKQDAAMQKYTDRDLADPYYFWDFDGLGWR